MRAALIAAVAALAACAPDAPATSIDWSPDQLLAHEIRSDLQRLDVALAADGVVAASIGETADLGSGLTIRPIDVKEDSRCPLNVDCVWAGQLVLVADVSGTERELTLGTPLETPQGTVLLAVAKPSPFDRWPATEMGGPPPPYRFGFRRS